MQMQQMQIPQQQPEMVPAEAFGSLRNMHQLSLEAFLSKSKQELVFRMLNRTILIAQYGRAVLFNLEQSNPKFLGVSGKSDVNEKTPLIQTYQRMASLLKVNREAKIVTREDLKDVPGLWEDISSNEDKEKTFLWLPVLVNEKPKAGLLLERGQSHAPWDEREIKMLGALALSYTAAWEKIFMQRNLLESIKKNLTKSRVIAAFILLLCSLFLIKVELRIVAPCEVIPKSPIVVAAPLDGVVAEVLVEPGQEVKKGQMLFEYDKSVLLEELNVVKQQVNITRQDLKRAQVQAFNDPKARSTILLLENKLAQDLIRLKLAQIKTEKLRVTAPSDGVVMISSPHEWRGRPVVVGERVLTIVNNTKLAVWLPENDNIPFDKGSKIHVFLNVAPDKTKSAQLEYVAKHITKTPEGVPSFLAEANWSKEDKDLRIGLEGTALLYGDKVSVFYWLTRKPWATIRQSLGI